MTDRRLLSELLAVLFDPSDIRETFAGGFSWLMRHPDYVLSYDRHGGGITGDPTFNAAKTVVIRELSNVLAGMVPGRITVEIPNNVRQTLAREVKSLTRGIPSVDLGGRRIIKKKSVLTAIDVTFDGPIRAMQVASDDHLIHLEDAAVVTKPVSAFAYVRDPKEYPPTTIVPTVYALLDQYFRHLTVPPLLVDRNPLMPALFAPPPLQPVHAAPERISIGLVSIFSDLQDVSWSIDDATFWGESTDPSRRGDIQKRLAWALTEATKSGVDIIVIPELNLDKHLEEFLHTTWAELRHTGSPLLLVGGLLHRQSDDTPNRYRNQPIFLTQDGNLLWPYWKREPMRVAFPDGIHRAEALIDNCTHVVSLDTVLGRMCIVICRDFMLDTTFRAIAATRANLVIVPAMTTKESVHDFKSKARNLADVSHAITIFCNSSVHLRRLKRPSTGVLGFVHPNTRQSLNSLASHHLPSPDAVAVLAIYRLRFRPKTPPTMRPRVLWTRDAVSTFSGYPSS